MARGRYLSLEEARKKRGGLKRFAEEHPSEGDEDRFDVLTSAMALGKPAAADRTSDAADGEGCDETQTPTDTSEGAS